MEIQDKAHLLNLPKILDERGNLSFAESLNHLPWQIRRVYWIYDVPGGEIRGGHAFKEQEEVIVALSGSLDIIINDGKNQYKYSLNRSYVGLYIPKMVWRHMENFSTNSVALVLSSTHFLASDYIRDFKEYIETNEIYKYSL